MCKDIIFHMELRICVLEFSTPKIILLQ